MATRAQKTKVGLFVIFCGLIVAGLLVLMTGYRPERRLDYSVEFEETILGLDLGGLVEYFGVPVGKVTDINVTDKGMAHVEIYIVPSKVSLHEGVTAQLVWYQLATGKMCISLRGGDPAKPMLRPGSVIPVAPSMLTSTTTQVQDALDKFNDIADSVKKGLSGMKEGQLTDAIKNTNDLITSGKDFLENANKALNDLKGKAQTGLEKFEGLADDLKTTLAKTNEAIAVAKDKISTLDVAQTQENLNNLLQDLSGLSKRIEESANSLDNVSKSALHEAGNVEFNMRETLRTLNEALDATRELTESLQKNPSSVIWGKGKTKGEQ